MMIAEKHLEDLMVLIKRGGLAWLKSDSTGSEEVRGPSAVDGRKSQWQ